MEPPEPMRSYEGVAAELPVARSPKKWRACTRMPMCASPWVCASPEAGNALPYSISALSVGSTSWEFFRRSTSFRPSPAAASWPASWAADGHRCELDRTR